MFDAIDQLTDRDYQRIHSVPYNRGFREWLRSPDPASARALIPIGEIRAMGISEPSAGGYLAPESFSSECWKRMTQDSIMRAVCTLSESIGLEWAAPYVDDSANRGRILPENRVATETDLTVGLKRLPAYLFDSDILRVSFQFLQDAGIEAVEEFLVESLTERVARNLNLHATTGNGANQPQGIVTAAIVGVTGSAGQITSVTFDNLTDLAASVSEPYVWGRDGLGNVGQFMMNGTTFGAVRKLKDGDGDPIWTPGPGGKTPGTLLGHRVVINSDMPNMAASEKAILFGDFACYAIRDLGLIVRKYSERFAEFGQLAFRVYSRHAAGLIDPTGIRAYQNSAT